jgi:hypothetical protein
MMRPLRLRLGVDGGGSFSDCVALVQRFPDVDFTELLTNRVPWVRIHMLRVIPADDQRSYAPRILTGNKYQLTR